MRAVFQKGLSLLLALFFSTVAGWRSGRSLASPSSPDSPPACHCCNANRSKCATPACCARPADDQSPVTPAAPRCASGQEWQALAPCAIALLTPQATSVHLTVRPLPIQAGSVPIFQRNCSFLL